jgi:two-component system chemotaxis response regulator CheY
MNVLVVDDSAVMRKIVIKALNEAGHGNVLEAGNGKDALAQVAAADIVFTDWNMPIMDGLTFVREVRKTSNILIVMITTEGDQKEDLEAMKSGVNDYIVKPFKPTVLLNKLETFLKK